MTKRRYDPDRRRLVDLRWLLADADAAALRRLLPADLCADHGAAAAQAWSAVDQRLSTTPNEKLSYACSPAR